MSMAFIIALLVSCLVLWSFYEHEMPCLRCGGRGRHRADCPLRREDDAGHDGH